MELQSIVNCTMIYAWSNNKHKPPRAGHKWDSCIKDDHMKKWLWMTWIVEFSGGKTVIYDPIVLNDRKFTED